MLAFACLIDWLATATSAPRRGSFRTATWSSPTGVRLDDRLSRTSAVLAPRPHDRVGQLVLAAGLAYLLLVRPWRRTPPIDDLAVHAEKAIPEFDHRLVTAMQLNRPGAQHARHVAGAHRGGHPRGRRDGVAAQPAQAHRLPPAPWALAVVAAGAARCGACSSALNPTLAVVLLKRQALLGVEIPRTIHLENVTQEVWPTGAEVVIRYRVTGEYDARTMVGRLRVGPDGQPERRLPTLALRDGRTPTASAIFVAEAAAVVDDFNFQRPARRRPHPRAAAASGSSRRRRSNDIEAWQLLPPYLGTRDGNGQPVTVPTSGTSAERGEVVDALPQSGIRVEATFNKPVVKAVLIPIERGEGNQEADGRPLTAAGDRRRPADGRVEVPDHAED